MTKPSSERAHYAVELRNLLRLALPMVIAQVGMMLLGVVDTVMVGHLSERALAAVALGGTYSWAAMVLGMGVLHGLDPLVAQAHGARDLGAISLALQRGLVLSLVVSVPYIALFEASAPILVALRQPPEVVEVAAPYLVSLAPGVPAFFAFVALRQTLQARGVVRPVLIAVVVGNLANYAGNLLLIHGRFGLPALGVVGSGWSTTICRYLMLAVVAWVGAPSLVDVWRPPSRRLYELGPYLRMLVIGLPIGVQIGLEMWVFTAAALLIGSMGALQMSGHQIAINLASLSFMVPLGIGAAAATRVGNAIGRNDAAGARRAAFVAVLLGASVMSVAALSFWLIPAELARVYSPDPRVVAAAIELLPIAALFQVFDGTQAVGCGILRGAADTRSAAYINFVGYWVLGLPLGYALAFHFGLGPRGLWWGLTLGLAVVATLVVLRILTRFRHALERV
jgi:MATE family multidrug resistance protein